MARLGIDIGGTSVKGAIIDQGGSLLSTARSREYARPSMDELVRAVAEAIPAGDDIDAIGLCVPGALDASKTRVEYSANLPALQELSLVEMVSRAIKSRGLALPPILRVHSDAAAAAFAYWHRHRPDGRLLALSLGTGVGAAIIDDARFVRLTGDSCGHVGQIDVSLAADAPIGPDGGRGGLEAYIGAPALKRALGDQFASVLATLPEHSPQIQALARALRICHAIYRPQEIALLGFVGMSLQPAAMVIRRAVDVDLTRLARAQWRLQFGTSPHLAAEGAALLSKDP